MNTYLYNGNVVTASSKKEVLAFNKDRISLPVKKAYEALNERFVSNGKIDENDLADQIRMIVLNNRSIERQINNKRVTIHSIVWQALEVTIKLYLEYCECPKTNLSSEQIKNWFTYNGTTYQAALKKAVDKIQDLRMEINSVNYPLPEGERASLLP